MHKVDVPTHGWAFPVSVHLSVCVHVCVFRVNCVSALNLSGVVSLGGGGGGALGGV